MNKKTLIICRGIPASGKSTWAKKWVEESPETRIRVSRDDIRFMLYGKYWGVPEDEVTAVQEGILTAAMQRGLDIAVDNTNLNAQHVKKIIRLGVKHGYEAVAKDFPIDLAVAIYRDQKREKSVGPEVVTSFYTRYLRKGGAFPPLPKVEWDNTVYRPYVADETLPAAYLFDLDGTLAHVDPTNPRDVYDASRADEDLLDSDVLRVLKTLFLGGSSIVLMSGRQSEFRAQTEKWLEKHNIPYDELHMRPEGDTRKDSIIKHELFYDFVAPRYNVLGVFDDRNQVVEMWRSIGLKCFQVQDGDF